MLLKIHNMSLNISWVCDDLSKVVLIASVIDRNKKSFSNLENTVLSTLKVIIQWIIPICNGIVCFINFSKLESSVSSK